MTAGKDAGTSNVIYRPFGVRLSSGASSGFFRILIRILPADVATQRAQFNAHIFEPAHVTNTRWDIGHLFRSLSGSLPLDFDQ